jgi:hypothetical protein
VTGWRRAALEAEWSLLLFHRNFQVDRFKSYTDSQHEHHNVHQPMNMSKDYEAEVVVGRMRAQSLLINTYCRCTT